VPSEAGRLQLLTTQQASPASRIEAASTTQSEEFEREATAMRAEQAAVTGAVERAKTTADTAQRYQPEIENIQARTAEIRAEVEDLTAKLNTMPEDKTVEHRVWKARPQYQMLKAEKEWREKELVRQDKRMREIQKTIRGEPVPGALRTVADTFFPGVFAGGE
jgi:chromosome segregation ATPase